MLVYCTWEKQKIHQGERQIFFMSNEFMADTIAFLFSSDLGET